MTDEERALFQLAENLHTPVTVLKQMGASEFMGWMEFYQHKQDQESGNLLNNPDALLAGLTGG